MRFFSKQEIKYTLFIIFFLLFFVYLGFKKALTRARDAQRMADLGVIVNDLDLFFQQAGYYPPSDEKGRIVGCNPSSDVLPLLSPTLSLKEKLEKVYKPCEWGKDRLTLIVKEKDDIKLVDFPDLLPKDPHYNKDVEKRSYFYISTLNRFQIFASLEDNSDNIFNMDIIKRNLYCGMAICNFGKSSGSVPLGISIEEYENILEKQKNEVEK